MKPSKKDWPKFTTPIELQKALSKKKRRAEDYADDKVQTFSTILKELKKIDRLELSKIHYFQFMDLGLYLEEYQQRLELEKFSLFYTRIHRVFDEIVRNKFKIYITINLDDPILKVSDSLRVYKCDGDREIFYYLKIAKIHKNHVIVLANEKKVTFDTIIFCFKYSPLDRYNVQLVFNDYNFRCGHSVLALINTKSVWDYIFPRKNLSVHNNTEELNKDRSWFNEEIEKNLEQKQAVLNICVKSSYPAPYILYGPPGTGKTATVVEAVSQIWRDSEEHILICAPSNAACDVVAKRVLSYIKPENVLRMYSQLRDYSTIDPDLKKCCNYQSNGFAITDIKDYILSTRIIITTLSTCAKLILLEFDTEVKFSHVFIDEAGQATQPDSLIPIQLMISTGSTCQIVISGDPKQLGPCVRSKLAEPILGESILEKIMRHEPYKKQTKSGYDPSYITKLIRNYRSSADIIHVSNKLFYDNELIACGGKKIDRFPVIFHAIKGTEKKVGASTSSYNQEEINEVINYVNYFIDTKIGDEQFSTKDIGIVTPFSLQSSKLRRQLEKRELEDVDVGTVEVFQGQEKEIIIMSTVRSKTFLHDKGKHIGFLSNPRRFNVGLTRAKTLLVVVGNPNALQVESSWRYFLQFCKENDSCRGHDFKLKEDINQIMKKLNLGIKIKRSQNLFGAKLKLFEITRDMQEKIKSIAHNSEINFDWNLNSFQTV